MKNQNSVWGRNWGSSKQSRGSSHKRDEMNKGIYILNTNSSIQATNKNDQYLDLMDQPPFIIKVNHKQYKCNSMGVNSSKVIQEFRLKNPNSNQYEYHIDNQNDEFQIICDLFNLKKVQITTKNINSLLRICDELQIEVFLDKITKFSDLYESIIQESDIIDDIYSSLYQIQTLTVEVVKNSILNSIWVQNFESIQELVSIFLQVIRTTSYQNQLYLIELVILLDQSSNEVSQLKQFLPFFIDKLKSTFFNSKLYCSFIYKMSQKGLISIDEIIDLICTLDPIFNEDKSNDSNKDQLLELPLENFKILHHKNVTFWFFPELYEKKNFSFEKVLKFLNVNEVGLIQYYFPEKIDQFKKIRDSFEPDNEIERSILNDDVDNLQKIISNNRIKYNNFKIPNSVLNVFDSSIEKSLINYAAECGSIKCFKFLLLNHAELDKFSYGFAIFGGNTEIIRIIDQKKPFKENNKNTQKTHGRNYNYNNNSDFKYDDFNSFFSIEALANPIKLSIIMHKYDLFDWMFEKQMKLNSNSEFLIELAKYSVQNGNMHSFVQLLDNGLVLDNNRDFSNELIKTSSILGFYKFSRLLGNFVGPISIPLFAPLVFGNLSIFKLYYTKDVTNIDFDLLLTAAVNKNYLNIIQYIIEELCNDNKQNKLNSFKFIEAAYSLKNTNVLDYLDGMFNLDNLKNIYKFNINQFRTLLKQACLSGNIESVKKVTDFIIKNYPKESFTNEFITAGSSGNEEICKYFIDKKVSLDISTILVNYKTLASKIGKIIINFLDSVDTKTKEKYSNFFLNEAIIKGNVNLVESLLNKDALNDQALFKAVIGRNVEIVKKILQCNSKPSFINQISPSGTALNIAVVNNDLPIVNVLLSLEGIDPSIRNSEGMTPLSSAITSINLKLTNAILNFYGDEIKNQIWQIKKAFKKILKNEQIMPNSFIGLYPIIDRMIKNVDFNFYIKNQTLLVFACQINDKKLVEILLKSKTIDVNLCDLKSSDSPLIISINSKNFEIADLLLGHPNININYKNKSFQTALTNAASNGFEKIIPYIIHHEKFDPHESCLNYAFYVSQGQITKDLYQIEGLDVNYKFIKGDDFKTNIDKAIIDGDEEKLKMIISHPSFEINSSFSSEIIFNNIFINDFKLLKKILEIAKLDINVCSSDGDPLFLYCAKNGHYNTVMPIIEDEDIKLTKNDFISSFISLFDNKVVEAPIDLMRQMIQFDEIHNHYINFNELLNDGKSFFTSISVLLNNVSDVVQFFLDHNVDPNKPDLNGIYPLEYAIKNKSHPFVVSLLLSEKIDFSVKLKDNETYVHLAEICYDDSISNEFIKRKMIDPNSKDYLEKKQNMRNLAIKSLLINYVIDNTENFCNDCSLASIINNFDLFENLYDKYFKKFDLDINNDLGVESINTKIEFCEKFYELVSERKYSSMNDEKIVDDGFLEILYVLTDGTTYPITEDLIITNINLFITMIKALNKPFQELNENEIAQFSIAFYPNAIKNVLANI